MPKNDHATQADEAIGALIEFSQTDAARAICLQYLQLLEQIDAAFANRIEAGKETLACEAGCCDCCYGVFEVSVLDLLLLSRAFGDVELDSSVFENSRKLSDFLNNNDWPFPHWWHSAPEENGFEELDAQPCPLLNSDGLCRVYSRRPSICRFQGLTFFDPDYPLDLEDDCPRQDQATKPAPFRLKEYYDKELELFHELTYHLPIFKTDDMGTWDAVIAGIVHARAPQRTKWR